AAMRTWLKAASEVLDSEGIHRRSFKALRLSADAYDTAAQTRDAKSHPDASRLAELRAWRQRLEVSMVNLERRHGRVATAFPVSRHPSMTAYFRTSFELFGTANSLRAESLRAEVRVDSGVVIYLNGQEALRDNLPPNAAHDTGALQPRQAAQLSFALSGASPRIGRNVLAVEVHNDNESRSDFYFELELFEGDRELVSRSSTWRYHFAPDPPPKEWYAESFDDGSWPMGSPPFGHGFTDGSGKVVESRHLLSKLDEQIGHLENRTSKRRTWSYQNLDSSWQDSILLGLLGKLERLRNVEREVRERLKFAESVKRRSITDHRETWDETIRSIADPARSPAYSGLRIEEQIGLVPIGQDPSSGLWEFAHLQTGEIPKRDRSGRLILNENVGIVLVLLPGGRYRMGPVRHPSAAPMRGARASEHRYAQNVTLAPFFLSKYEMTQAQWERFTGQNPSAHQNTSLADQRVGPLNPVEQVDWIQCDRTLRRLGLRLPTEAQWEYGARAGTTTVWSTGNERDSLLGHANLADQAATRWGARWSTIEDWPELDDGHGVHAPIGTYSANPWGLHEMHGNVAEWCMDLDAPYHVEPRADDGLRTPLYVETTRVYRGGSFRDTAAWAASGFRAVSDPSVRNMFGGCRPARLLTPTYED
ncbi:MAG: formylglycine-generating enzyme family protein, partial [Planctomycetota bacterium]